MAHPIFRSSSRNSSPGLLAWLNPRNRSARWTKDIALAFVAALLICSPGCKESGELGPKDGGKDGGGGGGKDGGGDGGQDGGGINGNPVPQGPWAVRRLFPNEVPKQPFAGCLFGSLQTYKVPGGGTEVIGVTEDGRVFGLDPVTGAEIWNTQVPVDAIRNAVVVSTPLILGHRLFVAYHTSQTSSISDPARFEHRVAAIDLMARAPDSSLQPVDVVGSVPSTDSTAPVTFLPSNALSRAQLAHLPPVAGKTLGTIYVTFGNVRDIQPWHGWAFEVDLDAWAASGAAAATTAVLATTPVNDCGGPGQSGSRERLCGGGLWSPTGPLVMPDGQSLILAPGNGQLDLAKKAFANTLMRVSRGLAFDPQCDPLQCADFNPDLPDEGCLRSCKNLFVPRPLPGEDHPRPESGVCDGLTQFQCWGSLDYIGGSTPAYLEHGGFRLLAYPTKDGHVYLVDAEHLGTLHDRKQLVTYCGTKEERCTWDWAGMIVSQPAVTTIEGVPHLVIPTFMPDTVHPAGIVGLKVVIAGGKPLLEKVWEVPEFGSAEAQTQFRRHPTAPAISVHGDTHVAWVVDVPPPGQRGDLYAINVKDGTLISKSSLLGPGRRFSRPLTLDNKVFVTTCDGHNEGPSFVEAFELFPQQK